MTQALNLGRSDDGQPCSVGAGALTTHAFCVGMTGSGKTGLCAVLVEELLRSGVPVIAVDSKGDLGTLLLNLPPADQTAMARWGGDATRVRGALEALGLTEAQHAALLASYEPRIYTPGSTVGLPLDLIGSLAPPAGVGPDGVAEAADGIARALLGLVGVDADPVTSREYLLLVQILTTAWETGQTPTLVDLVRHVGSPPFSSVGALGLEDFFAQKDRQALMIRLNGLIASPKFAAWRQGEPLDPGTLLRGPDGRPRLSVYSVAHLGDDERLSAVALLLERVQAWMRRQGGSPSLRAVVLIDEIVGYFPPAPFNPPTKPPLIALLKQARAFGVGVVLATQNPIDLDYRGLANIGTWLLGRLQTEQDKARLKDALVAAASAGQTTPAQLDALISGLAPRQFLLHSVHRPAPTVFRTRDAVTILRGPLGEDDLRALALPMRSTPVAAAPSTSAPRPAVAAPVGVDAELGPLYEIDEGQAKAYLLLKFGVRYRAGSVTSEETVHELAFPLVGTLGPAEALEAEPLSTQGVAFQSTPPERMALCALPSWATALKAQKVVQAVRDRLPAKLETKLLVDPETKLVSSPVEPKEAFLARVMEKQGLSKAAKTLTQKLERKRLDAAQIEKELSVRKAEKWMSVGSGVMGLFAGRRSSVTSVTRVLSSHRQQGGAESKLEDLRLEIAQLTQQVAQLDDVDERRLQEQLCLPRAGDVTILKLALAFIVP